MPALRRVVEGFLAAGIVAPFATTLLLHLIDLPRLITLSAFSVFDDAAKLLVVLPMAVFFGAPIALAFGAVAMPIVLVAHAWGGRSVYHFAVTGSAVGALASTILNKGAANWAEASAFVIAGSLSGVAYWATVFRNTKNISLERG